MLREEIHKNEQLTNQPTIMRVHREVTLPIIILHTLPRESVQWLPEMQLSIIAQTISSKSQREEIRISES